VLTSGDRRPERAEIDWLLMDSDNSHPTLASGAAAPRGRLDGALARASDAPLREGNHLELLRNGPDTYED
jgi:hypothetical protein